MKILLHTSLIIASFLIANQLSAQNKIFYTDNETQTIGEYDLDSEMINIIKQGPGDVGAYAFAIDTVQKRAFWVTRNEIRTGSLSENIAETLYDLPESGSDFDIEYNYETNTIFVTEFQDQVIYKYDFEIESGSVLLDKNDNIGFPFSVASTTTDLYWSSGDDLYISGLDGSNPRILATGSSNARLYRLAIDETNEWVYWSDFGLFGNPPTIKRFKLADGSEEEVVVDFSDSDETPEGITVIPQQDKLYWLNRLGDIIVADLEGTVQDTIANVRNSGQDFNNLEIDTDTDNIYWSQFSMFKLENSSIEKESLFTAFFPEEISFDADINTLFYTDLKKIVSLDLSNSAETLFLDENDAPFTALSFDVDTTNNKIFWSDLNNIYSMDYSGNSVDTVVNATMYNGIISGLSVDPVNQELYFTDNASSTFGSLRKIKYDGSGIETLINQTLNYATGLIVDPTNQKIYWRASNNPDSVKIIQTDFNGTEKVVIVTEENDAIGSPLRLAVSSNTNQLFWTDIDSHTIWKSSLDGNNLSQITIEGTSSLVGIDVFTTSISTSILADNEIPNSVVLEQNYPNPFNPTTTIGFSLPQSSKVTLEVFDILGKKVATLLVGEQKNIGSHSINFDAKNLASGIYVYRLKTSISVVAKKLTLIK